MRRSDHHRCGGPIIIDAEDRFPSTLRLLALVLLTLAFSGARAQQTSDRYTTRYSGTSITSTSIKHKAAKWHSFRSGLSETQKATDTFDDEQQMMLTLDGKVELQATHIYTDTIYMYKGTSITLVLPYLNADAGAFGCPSYQRWFNFRTDGNFNYKIKHGSSTVPDLLTMASTSNTGYRFQNGYVGGWFTGSSSSINALLINMEFYYPTDEEYNTASTSNPNGDNSFYVVGCDVSQYLDFANNSDGKENTFGNSNSWYEPTLDGRTLFYIVGVDEEIPDADLPEGCERPWLLLRDDYQGGGNEDGDKYLEEYEITFPARRTSNGTCDLVTLSKDARAYSIPGQANASNEELTVTIVENNFSAVKGRESAGLVLAKEKGPSADGDGVSITISGEERVISFYREGTRLKAGTTLKAAEPDKVADGSKATIIVTKQVGNTTYNIARYRLTFKDEFTPLTGQQVAELDELTEASPYWWKEHRHRSLKYMEENYKLLTSLDFSYDETVNANTVLPSNGSYSSFETHYPFPMSWDYSSYAFYDGSSQAYFKTGGAAHKGTKWCMYGITNDYVSNIETTASTTGLTPPSGPQYANPKQNTGYWIYVDASDRPGKLAEIRFEENLCLGSKLLVSAWIKSAGERTSDDASMLMTINGVRTENGREVHTPIYRYCPGQIRKTTWLNYDTGDASNYWGCNDIDEDGLGPDVTGKGEGTNEWFQVFFSFVNSSDVDYDYYTLKLDNYCASTQGGDYYYDEIRVYVEHPRLEVTQIDPICTTEEEKSLVRMDLDYETMMSRLGLDPTAYTDDEASVASVDFVVFNKTKYYNAIAAGTDEREAFEAALVTFWGSEEDESGHQFPTFDFFLNYSKNKDYDESNLGGNLATFGGTGLESDEAYFFYRVTEYGDVELAVDCFTDMMAYTTYTILLEPHVDRDNLSKEEKLDLFISLLSEECAICMDFYLKSTTLLKINGEAADPTADYCAGQTLVVAPEVTYTDENGETVNIDGVYFDWFLGSRDEYVAVNETYGVSLQEALMDFRLLYPDAEELSDATPPTGNFTDEDYAIINHYLNEGTDLNGYDCMLVLHKSHLDVRVLSTGIELVVQPIAVYLEEAGDMLEICFGYVPLTLMASGNAPTLKPGFSNINYPDNDYEPCLRLGLAQFENCGANNPFTVNLHNATYVTEDGVSIDHLGVAEGMDLLLLVDTDDPAYHEAILSKEDGDELVVGKVARLYAKDNDGDDPRSDAPSGVKGSYMQIYFNIGEDEAGGWSPTPFTVREGYYYVLTVYFQEKGPFNEGEEAVGTACWGTFPLEMKIVPEYLVWTGCKSDNWNNDNHWRRADRSDLYKTTTATTDDPYPTNEANGTDKGFVPMLFSKVIMPRDSKAELYMAGFKEVTNGMLSWEGDENTANHDDVAEHPTSNIMYDLMLHETVSGNTSSFKTEHYRVNLCEQIHFEPGAQLLHSEQLIYNKAWTDVKLGHGAWALAATPLRDVVSGDWYTKKATGTETAEFFTDITFDTDSCDRYNPLVYQRNWSNEGNVIVHNGGADVDVPAYVSTGWSSVYNDVSVAQQAGEGFSIKASRTLNTDGTVDNTDSLMFRFPKADTEYAYQDGSETATISRENAGRLLISSLVSRTEPDKDNNEDVYIGTVNVSLTQTGNDYYIIGNPYTAPMSMKEFMAENPQFVGYWTEATYGPVVGTKDGTSWGTADCLIEPYGAFFVTTDESNLTRADGYMTVTFTKGMQEFKSSDTSNPARRQTAFSIRATGGGGTTSASIAYTDKATDNYSAGEDALLMEDVSWRRDRMPLVYTVAGDKAVSVNTLKQLTLIPIGAFADEGSTYTLSFAGVDMLEEPALVDTYENTETPLTEGFTLEVEGPTHGRYFIKVGRPILTEIEETASPVSEVSVYSPVQRTVVVSSDAGLESVEIYSVGGMLLKRLNASGSVSCIIDGVASGIAIVKVKTTEGTMLKKIRVR